MPMLSNIVVGLTATTGRFKRDMKDATQSVKRFSSGAMAITKRVAQFGTVAAAAAVGGLALLTKRSMSSIDATAKLADRIGMSTEKLQGLRHAADITGAGSETMDKALQKMQKTLGEAAQGIGQGRYALDALGMSVDDFARKSPDEQFSLVADKVKGLATAEDRAFVATNLFGRSGQSLINTMMLGSKGIADMQSEAEKLGVAFSRVDAAKVEAANDSLTRVGKVFQGIGNTLAIQLSPYIESAAMKFVEMASSGEGMGERISNGIRWVAESIAESSRYLDLMSSGFYAVLSGASTMISGVVNGFEIIKAAGYSLAAVFGEAFGAVLKSIGKGVSQLEFEAKKIWNYWQRVTGGLSDAEEIKANNRARLERDSRAKQIESAGGSFSETARQNMERAKASFNSGITGKAGEEWDFAAKRAADNAVKSYDRFINGTTKKQVEGFFDSIERGAHAVAEQVAANAAAMNSGETAPETNAAKIEGNVRGSFSAASLIAGPGRIEKDQLDTQKKMLNELKGMRLEMEDTSVALAG